MFLQAHDGGVVAVEISRVLGGAPQMITIGVDKTLAIWDTVSFKVLSSHWYFLVKNYMLEFTMKLIAMLPPF